MTDWTAGYVTDIGYPYGYYTGLNPIRARLAFLSAGIIPPALGVHCELGYGQGLSANVHAAASGSRWHATDFNPCQAGFAQSLALKSGADVQLLDGTFEEFCNRADLPDFDSIGLHGVWSWISDSNRLVIVDFIRRKLKVGGVLYISYNTQPGWAAFAPMRHLMAEHAGKLGAAGHGIVNRINGALEFCEKLLVTNPVYALANPHIAERIAKMKGQDLNYIAHEYFNRDWHPMHFTEMANWLDPAKVSFACSAHYHDHIDALNLTSEQQMFLMKVQDKIFRETVRDFMVNQQFRRDYWVKGTRKLSPLEQGEAISSHKVMLAKPRADISLEVTGASGKVELLDAIYGPILDMLSDHRPRTLAEVEFAVKAAGVGVGQLLQAVLILTGTGAIEAVQDDATIEKARKLTDKLNAHLLDKARGSGDVAHLASPVTGGGVMVSRVEQLFLLAISQGKNSPVEWVQVVWEILSLQQQKLINGGQVLESAEDNISELTSQANIFAEKKMSILKALKIV